MYVCVCVCAFVRIYIYIYIYAHTNTWKMIKVPPHWKSQLFLSVFSMQVPLIIKSLETPFVQNISSQGVVVPDRFDCIYFRYWRLYSEHITSATLWHKHRFLCNYFRYPTSVLCDSVRFMLSFIYLFTYLRCRLFTDRTATVLRHRRCNGSDFNHGRRPILLWCSWKTFIYIYGILLCSENKYSNNLASNSVHLHN